MELTPSKQKKFSFAKLLRNKWCKRLIAVAVVAAVVLLFVLPALSGGKAGGGSNYLVDQAQVRDMTITVSGTGTIEPIHSYKVTSLVKGEILSAPLDKGSWVDKDTVLYQIDSSDVENSIARAQLAVDQANLTYNQLLRNQKDTAITADASGTVQVLHVEVGDMVTAGSPVASILDSTNMELTVPFHAQQVEQFYVGQTASVAVSGTAELLIGSVTEVSAVSTVGPGGTMVRNVTVSVVNPGALSPMHSGTVTIGDVTCANSANFTYASETNITAKTTGTVGAIHVAEGDWVNDGQTLITFSGDSLSDQIEVARLSLRSAQLALESTQDSLDNYTIKAPIAGTLIELNYQLGDNVDPSTVATSGASPYMAVIYDMNTLTFDMAVHELDIGKLELGQVVEVTSKAVEGKTFIGHVDTININGTTINGTTTYPVTVVLEDASDLLPGMNISAKVIVEKVGEVLSIPVEAVTRGNTVVMPTAGALSADGTMVVDASKTETRTVELGRNDENYIEILGGLEEGDQVLIQNIASNAMDMMMGGV